MRIKPVAVSIAKIDLKIITSFIGKQLDGLCKSSMYYCPMGQTLDKHNKTRALLGASGRDNRELDSAITAADKTFKMLNTVQDLAVACFKAGGFYVIVDET